MSRYLVNARNLAESTEKSRFSPPRVEVCSVGPPPAGRVFEWAITQPIVRDDPQHHIVRALTSARAFASATCRERPHVRRCRPLNNLTAREPTGLSSRRRLFLLASHRMALTGERKNPNWIARWIKIFSIFAWLVKVSTLVPKHNSRIWVLHSTICWSWWSINIYETFGAKKIAVSLQNVVSAPCSETGPDLRTSLFVDRWL